MLEAGSTGIIMTHKIVQTPDYNYWFISTTGKFARWGKTFDDDPQYSPIGPEIADIEISTICHGINGIPCDHCYKSNTSVGKNMTLGQFEKVFDKLPRNIGQIAFGIGDVDGNPDMFSIFKHCRDNNVVPNVTINGDRLTDDIVEKLVSLCGAIAVSRYDDKNVCYNAVKRLTDAGLKQVNIHQLVSEETYANCIETIEDCKTDERLSKLNALVFLSLKQKGRGLSYKKLRDAQFNHMIALCISSGVPFGFDSCSCNKFLECVTDEQYKVFAEPCESTLFSIYVDVDGWVYPCSFCSGIVPSIDIFKVDDFLQDVWYSEDVKDFRKVLLSNKRNCPIFDV
jgi:MoaA/NifB/PqqE/SkfB family radical SAM enzyme